MKLLTQLALTIGLLLTICNGSFAQGFVPITVSGTVETDSLGGMLSRSLPGYTILGDPVPGIDISLDEIPGGTIARDTTNSMGGYSFIISAGGTYRVRATPPAGSMIVFPPETTYTFTAVSDVNQTNLNFRIRFGFGSTSQDNWAYFPSGTNQALTTVAFFNPDTGFAAGVGGVIVRTTDEGRSWDVVSNSVFTASIPLVENHNSSRSNKTTSANPGGGMIVGNNGQILRTENYGASWTTIASPTTVNLYGITDDKDNYSENIVYAVGDIGKIIKSTDGGFSWFTQTSPTTNTLRTVTFWNADTGIAAGDGGIIVRTTNGGGLWTILPDSSFAAGILARPMVENHNSSRSNKTYPLAPNNGGGVLTGDLNPIIRMTNYGANLDPIPTAASSSKGYISGKGGDGRMLAIGDHGAYLTSSDDGVSWTMQTSRTNKNLNSVAIKEEGVKSLSKNLQSTQLDSLGAVVVGAEGLVGVLQPPGFTINPPGPTWYTGSSQTITWSGGNPSWSVSISLMDVNTWTAVYTITASTTNDGSEVWNIPSNVPSGAYQIYVQEVNQTTWSYSSSFIISASVPGEQILISVDSTNASVNDTVVVPVRVSFPMGQSYTSAEVNFGGFQNQGLTFLRVDTVRTLIGQHGWLLTVNSTDTLLVTASAGAQNISGNAILYKLRFLVSGGSCTFIPITLTKALFNTGLDTVQTTNGGVFVNPIPNYGDVDENGPIQAFDASLILRHLARFDTLGCQGLINANVSNDTTVSALDASLILMYVVGLINHLPYDTTIVATGNIAMVGGSAGPGDTVAVPILLSNGNNILSFEGLITFDPSRLTFSRIQWSSSLGNFMIQAQAVNGELYLAGAGTAQDGSAGTFATLNFINNQTVGQTQITFRRLRWNEGTVMENVAMASVITGVDEEEGLPTKFALEQSYPNPFNPSTRIRFAVPAGGFISVRIFNTLGQEVAVLVNEHLNPGRYEYGWNGTGYPSGVYFYRMQAEGFTQTKKLILLR